MFRIKKITKIQKDGSFDVEFETEADWETFKAMAKKEFNRKNYSKKLGNDFMNHIIKHGIDIMKEGK